MRLEQWRDGALEIAEEITREPDLSVRYRRWDGAAVLQEDRAATAREAAALVAYESGENQTSVAQTLAQQALERLQAAREAGTSVYQTLGTVPAGTMTTATLSTVVRQMAEAQRTLIRDALDEVAAVERLLVRAVAGLYDAAD